MHGYISRLSAGQLRQILWRAHEGMNTEQRESLTDHVRELAKPRKRRTQTTVNRDVVIALADAGHDHAAIARITSLTEKRIHSIIGHNPPSTIRSG